MEPRFGDKLFVTAERPRNREFAKLELSHLAFARAVAKEMELNASWGDPSFVVRRSNFSFDEAEDALAFAKEKNGRKIIIVTDEFHTRRAIMLLRKHLMIRIKVVSCSQ